MTARHRVDPFLDVDEVTAGYGGTQVLEDVSLVVGEGETVGLVGRNGVGKTTTLQTIMGNVKPRSGSITFDGVDITEFGPEETCRQGVTFVPEERRIFPSLTVRENLELARLGGGERGLSRDIDTVLDTFENLAAHENSLGNTLSGGEQQMLAIARALVGTARLLLLDEPTEGLAPLIIKRVIEVVETLNTEGLTILLVEQNVRVALDTCDYLYILEGGQIVHEAPADDLAADQAILDRHLGVQ